MFNRIFIQERVREYFETVRVAHDWVDIQVTGFSVDRNTPPYTHPHTSLEISWHTSTSNPPRRHFSVQAYWLVSNHQHPDDDMEPNLEIIRQIVDITRALVSGSLQRVREVFDYYNYSRRDIVLQEISLGSIPDEPLLDTYCTPTPLTHYAPWLPAPNISAPDNDLLAYRRHTREIQGVGLGSEPYQRALHLLNSFLDEEQRETLDKESYFFVYGGVSGVRYRVRWGLNMNIDVYLGDTKLTICSTPQNIRVPIPDHLLSLYLMIRADEASLVAVANLNSGDVGIWQAHKAQVLRKDNMPV